MNSKKFIMVLLIIIALVIFSTILYFSLAKPTLVNNDGSITSTGKDDLMAHLREVENIESRKNQIDFALESNLITQEEANSLY